MPAEFRDKVLVEGDATCCAREDGAFEADVVDVSGCVAGARELRCPSTLPPPSTLRDIFGIEVVHRSYRQFTRVQEGARWWGLGVSDNEMEATRLRTVHVANRGLRYQSHSNRLAQQVQPLLLCSTCDEKNSAGQGFGSNTGYDQTGLVLTLWLKK